jgi:serine/threonine-protein kinase
MELERWRQIDRLLEEALEREESERAQFLDEACAGDEALRKEIESLIRYDERAKGFIERPAIEIAAEALAAEQMGLAAGQQLGPYKIESLLGAGGMGEVYLAQDTRLGRKVAIKFPPHESVTDERAKKRLFREAQSAAKLDHPNICAIHEVAEQDGRIFIVMQYVEGETLAARIQREPLSLTETLDVTAQVADALAEAHSRGIIHRDIKPQNIMVTARGQVKVLDFGLAKLVKERALIESLAETESLLTAPGVIVGTVPYMSPEQLSDETLDARTDIFSFGAVLYETVSGHQPFAAESTAAIISAILTREPPPLARFAREVPAELERITAKALRKDREERYQVVKDMLLDLRSLKHRIEFEAELERSKPPEQDRRAATETTVPDAAGSATLNVAAAQTARGAQLLTSKITRGRRGIIIAAVALIIAAAAFAYVLYFARSAGAIDSIAVLPLANAGDDPNVEYLSDGISEALINSLTELRQLKVVARSTAFRYRGKDDDPQTVGRELNVRAVLTGRVRQMGDRLDIQVDLVDATTGAQIWGEKYERKVSDMLSIKQAIAREVTEKLRLRLSGEDEQRLVRRDTTNAEAYQLYLRGRFHWNKRTVKELQKAIEFFRQAVTVDPDYALGYAGLADGYTQFSQFSDVPSREVMPKAKEAALKAISLDDLLAEAHAALGLILFLYDYDFAGAEREFKRAIELNPNYASAHHFYARLLSALGRHEESFAQVRLALEIDPLALPLNWFYGHAFFLSRRYDESIDQLKKTLELDASFPGAYEWLARVYHVKGDYDQCVEVYAKYQELIGQQQTAALARESFARSGWQGFLRAMIKRPDLGTYFRAVYYASLGEKDEAFAALDKGYENRDPFVMYLKVDPRLDPLRDDPRYKALLQRIGY